MEHFSSCQLFQHTINVRIDDINFGNHLCHSKFINIIHNTRALFLKKHNLSESNIFNHGMIILNLQIDYISQCFFNDLLEITLSIEQFSKSTLSLSYTIINHTTGKLASKARTLTGFIDLKEGKLKKIPVEFYNLIDKICNSSSE